jgi:4-diphosphocytidyl-2-C-methyl-D-erythritol kinase
VRIRLAKSIPAAAGLGGGSSDAGAVLRALSARFPEALGAPALAQLALSVGADVPFFLAPAPARVGGIGERIEPLARFGPLACLLANPGLPLSTAAVFAAWDARPVPAPPAFDRALGLDLANDLEAAAERLCPAIAPLRQRLLAAGARAVALSGSGPTLFGIFGDPAEAARALAEAELPGPIWARVAQTPKAG